MKNLNGFIIVFSFLAISCGQDPVTPPRPRQSNPDIDGKTITVQSGCNYNRSMVNSTVDYHLPGQRAQIQVKNILKYAGLPANFDLYESEISNAVAFVYGNKRIIMYDERLLDLVDNSSNSYWSSMSILAHEIGHHLSGHTLGNDQHSSYKSELEADRFSGFVLQKMGASLSQAQHAMAVLGSESSSSSHPPRLIRLEEIRNGWEEANNLRYEAAIPPPPADIVNPMGGIDEFQTENLIDEPSYESIRSRSGYGFGVSDKMDGIIVECEKNHYYSVLVTRTTNNDTEYLNKTISIEMYDPWDSYDPLGRAQYSWLDAIMVPGRRIRFAFLGQGSGDFKHFVYVKSLPGSLY
jgi:hypothetical protein